MCVTECSAPNLNGYAGRGTSVSPIILSSFSSPELYGFQMSAVQPLTKQIVGFEYENTHGGTQAHKRPEIETVREAEMCSRVTSFWPEVLVDKRALL